jgi:hypothetical protein
MKAKTNVKAGGGCDCGCDRGGLVIAVSIGVLIKL